MRTVGPIPRRETEDWHKSHSKVLSTVIEIRYCNLFFCTSNSLSENSKKTDRINTANLNFSLLLRDITRYLSAQLNVFSCLLNGFGFFFPTTYVEPGKVMFSQVLAILFRGGWVTYDCQEVHGLGSWGAMSGGPWLGGRGRSGGSWLGVGLRGPCCGVRSGGPRSRLKIKLKRPVHWWPPNLAHRFFS